MIRPCFADSTATSGRFGQTAGVAPYAAERGRSMALWGMYSRIAKRTFGSPLRFVPAPYLRLLTPGGLFNHNRPPLERIMSRLSPRDFSRHGAGVQAKRARNKTAVDRASQSAVGRGMEHPRPGALVSDCVAFRTVVALRFRPIARASSATGRASSHIWTPALCLKNSEATAESERPVGAASRDSPAGRSATVTVRPLS